jgi:hypothetical protein
MGNRTVAVRLDKDKQGITATMPEGPDMRFKFRFCGDAKGGSVCLKHIGADVDYATAARKIMEPLLFGGDSPYAVPAARHPIA